MQRFKIPYLTFRSVRLQNVRTKNSSLCNHHTANITNRLVPIATKLFIKNNGYRDYCIRRYNSTSVNGDFVDYNLYEKVCEETLESLTEYFEEIVEGAAHLKLADVSYGSGVLTVDFGEPYGTYVINRQSPNRQIWLSSPKSGPKRYDYVVDGGYWIYKHDGKTLHQLLQEEIPDIVKSEVDFSRCSYAKLD